MSFGTEGFREHLFDTPLTSKDRLLLPNLNRICFLDTRNLCAIAENLRLRTLRVMERHQDEPDDFYDDAMDATYHNICCQVATVTQGWINHLCYSTTSPRLDVSLPSWALLSTVSSTFPIFLKTPKDATVQFHYYGHDPLSHRQRLRQLQLLPHVGTDVTIVRLYNVHLYVTRRIPDILDQEVDGSRQRWVLMDDSGGEVQLWVRPEFNPPADIHGKSRRHAERALA